MYELIHPSYFGFDYLQPLREILLHFAIFFVALVLPYLLVLALRFHPFKSRASFVLGFFSAMAVVSVLYSERAIAELLSVSEASLSNLLAMVSVSATACGAILQCSAVFAPNYVFEQTVGRSRGVF
ncbi:hypothetical protein [Pseudomarimonas arenosa]|uniref:Uncharacterized protein n=1 Tax=Pseudomarimonas arenosa TaxID=2774145 RepID=A0AAW3ZRY0_9GAMM|nr:hypothetical protein [Pseudomarimonas arenosa]MBD8527862.1 hypothetical protein [Pseudomarimonas arenosa]